MDRRKKDAQISVEYMFLIGFATVITIPLIIIYQSFIHESSVEITSSQINQVAQNVVDAAESVYYLGEPSQTTIKANIPGNIVSADLSAGYEVVFKIRDKSGMVDIVRNSAVNITGSLPVNKGTYTITVKAAPNHAEVSYK